MTDDHYNGKYSDNEMKMFTDLGWSNLLDICIDEMGLYEIAIEKAFINNDQCEAANALRKAADALSKCNPYRMTPEFEELISY